MVQATKTDYREVPTSSLELDTTSRTFPQQQAKTLSKRVFKFVQQQALQKGGHCATITLTVIFKSWQLSDESTIADLLVTVKEPVKVALDVVSSFVNECLQADAPGLKVSIQKTDASGHSYRKTFFDPATNQVSCTFTTRLFVKSVCLTP